MIDPAAVQAIDGFVEKARTEGRSLADVLDSAQVLLTDRRREEIQNGVVNRIKTGLRREMDEIDMTQVANAPAHKTLEKVLLWLEAGTWRI